MIDGTEGKNTIKVAVLCINKAGEREFYKSSQEVTQEEIDSGEHYDLAIEAAEDQELEVIMPFDENDYASGQLHELDVWMNGGNSNQNSNAEGTLIESTVRDWRLSDGHTESDLLPAHCGEYSIKVEHGKGSSCVSLSVCPTLIKDSATIPAFGLHAMVEIREGLPAISIGVNPDEHLVHVVSDTSSCMAVVPESNENTGNWKPVPFIEKKYDGYCFDVESYGVLDDMRRVAAEKTFEDHDFGSDQIIDDGGWSVSGDIWEKPVFIANPAGGNSMKKLFTVKFADRLAVPVDMSC